MWQQEEMRKVIFYPLVHTQVKVKHFMSNQIVLSQLETRIHVLYAEDNLERKQGSLFFKIVLNFY